MNIDPIFATWMAVVVVLFANYIRAECGGTR